MPIGEVAGEAIGAVVRFAARVVLEIVFELIVRGTGYAILGAIRPGREPSGGWSAFVGFVFWLSVIAGGVWLYQAAA